MGKVLEVIVTERLALVAEEHGLMPKGQMGKRKGRSTEFAIRVVTERVHTAGELGAVASILLLDLKGAFNWVNHRWLLHTLWEKGAAPMTSPMGRELPGRPKRDSLLRRKVIAGVSGDHRGAVGLPRLTNPLLDLHYHSICGTEGTEGHSNGWVCNDTDILAIMAF